MTELAKRRASLYDSLARYEWLRRRMRRARTGESLELHKALGAAASSDAPSAGKADLHRWMWEKLEAQDAEAVLDVGCGFGATIFSWARGASNPRTRFVGLGSNAYQIGRARDEAEKLGLGERCEFRHQSYDDAIVGSFDRVISVEAIFHSEDLTTTLENVARALAPGGRMLAVEDALDDRRVPEGAESVREDVDAEALRVAWSAPRLHTIEDWRAAARAAGLEWAHEYELSEQVLHRPLSALGKSEARLRRLRKVPSRRVRDIADAFLGGLALERLYARRVLRYLAIDLRKKS